LERRSTGLPVEHEANPRVRLGADVSEPGVVVEVVVAHVEHDVVEPVAGEELVEFAHANGTRVSPKRGACRSRDRRVNPRSPRPIDA